MSEANHIVDAEYSDSQEIIPRVEVALSVERDPAVVLAEARKAAKVLQEVVESDPNKVTFNKRTYLTFEDWQTVARFYGVSAKVVSSAYVEYGNVKGFEARAVVVRTSNGVEISAAEAMCLNDEENWGPRTKYEWKNVLDDKGKMIWEFNEKKGKKLPKSERVKVGEEPTPLFQLKSMAQTRACAKALRNVLAFVPVLAGYSPTPSEEMLIKGSQEAADEVGVQRLAEMQNRVAAQKNAKKPIPQANHIKVHSYPEDILGDVELSGLGCKTAGLKRQSEADPTRYLMAYEKMDILRKKCQNLGITLEEPPDAAR